MNFLIKYGDGVSNTPPEILEFAQTSININGFDMEAMFDTVKDFLILSYNFTLVKSN